MDDGGEGAKEEGKRQVEKRSAMLLKAVCFRPRLFALMLCSALPTSSGSYSVFQHCFEVTLVLLVYLKVFNMSS